MSTQSIQQTYPIFTDIDGQPLEGGNIYIGTAGLAAATNQINIYWDAALTSAATQPLTTRGGYIMNSGSPANVYTSAPDYSIAVNDKNNTPVTSSLNKGERVSSAYVSVTDYGAVGDNVNDDTSAINACLAANKNVFFPAGTYKISADLTLQDGQSIQGVKGQSIIEVTNYGGGYAFYAVNMTAGGAIRNMRVNCNFYAYGVNIFNSNNVTIEDCHFKDGDADCIYIDGDVTNAVIKNCIIEDATRNGISVIDADGIVIDGCEIKGTNATRSGGSPYSGIDVEPNPSDIVKNIRISNNSVKDWGGHGIAFAGIVSDTQAVQNASCTGNTIENCDFDCILVSGGGCEGISVIGNTMFASNKGIASTNVSSANPPVATISGNYITAMTGVTTVIGMSLEVDSKFMITGNQISGVRDPINLASMSSGCSINGNYIVDCTQPISVFSSSNVNMTGNIFKAGLGIDIVTSTGISVQGNSFADMDATATELVNVRTTSSNVSVSDNIFNGTGAALVAFVAQSTSTNVFISGNQGVVQGGISQWLQSGSWTPTYLGTTSNPTVGYDGTVVGEWERQGNLVYISGFLMTDSISGGSGTVKIGGLPYDVATGDCCNGGLTISFSSDFTTNQPSSLRALGGSKEIGLYYRSSSNGSSTDLPISDLQNAANKNILYFGGVYRTDENV